MTGVDVRVAVRAISAGVFTFVALVAMMVTSTMTSIITAAAVAATTALIMGGTGDPLSTPKDTLPYIQQYMGMAVNNYIAPSGIATPPKGESYNAVAVITPEEWAPQTGTLTLDQSIALGKANLDNCIKATDCEYNTDVGSAAPAAGDKFVVFGYSQSATIGTFEKRSLAAEFPDGGGPDVSFTFIGNGNRPNGGFLARGPEGFTIPNGLIFGGATFSGATPTNTQYETVDIAEQYDVWADVPLNPLNLLAVANWYSSYVHYNYKYVSLNDPGIIDQGQYGDTHYYMIPQKVLPLLSSVTQVPVIGTALADALDAPLRVLVEAAYDRTISPGQPMAWNPLYFPNPVKLASSLAASIPVGLDNAFEDTIGIRPFGTQRPGPYGVGGPDVTYVNPPAAAATTTAPRRPRRVSCRKAPRRSRTPLRHHLGLPIRARWTRTRRRVATMSRHPVKPWPRKSRLPMIRPPSPRPGSRSTDSNPVASPKDVRGKKSLPDTVSTDVPAADTATTQSPTEPKRGEDAGTPARQPRHAFRGDRGSNPIMRRISELTKEAQSAATSTSTSAGADSTSKESEPEHAH